ncbi:MAG: TolC family protein [Sphaerochaetaceae bacterium]|nr:TolC family protein [Sphaerochaetaceae bacterium]
MLKKLSTIALLVLLSVFLWAGETLTLEQALQKADENNLSLASASIDVAGAERDMDTAWNLFLPSLNLSISTSGMTPVFQAPETTTMSWNGTTFVPATVEIPASNQGLSLGLSASFQLNPAVKDQLEAYAVAYQIERVTYQQAKAEIDKSVTQLFYYLLMQKENIAVQERNLDLAQQRYDETLKKFESGFASETEVLSSQLAAQQLKPALQQAKNEYQSNLLSFKALIGVPVEAELSLQGEIPALIGEVDLGEIDSLVQSTYTVQLLGMNLKQLQVNRELSRKQAFYPTLSVSGNYGLSLWSEQYSNTFSDSLTYQVALSIPLDGHIPDSRGDVGMQKIDESIRKLALQRELTIEQMGVQFATQLQAIQMFTLQLDLARQSLALTQQLYDMQLTQYETGYISVIDLEEAQNNLLSAQVNILSLQYQYINALIELASILNIDMKELY